MGLKICFTKRSTEMPIHIGFDLGIRNLAYCVVEHGETGWKILHWDNIDLLESGQSSQTSRLCVACPSKATYTSGDKRWCTTCATGIRRKKKATELPTVPVLPCATDVKSLRSLACSIGIDGAKKMKKDALLLTLSSRYLLPWTPAKAADASLTEIRRSMNTWLDSMLPTFALSSLIRLENQPVLKGPTMKSVQIILFTLLGSRLEREHAWTGSIEFVHAGRKVTVDADLPEGEAYRARKKAAETEVMERLTVSGSSWLPFFQSRTKKNDLADAFLMALRL